jgi:hypothetical protein
MTKWLSDIFISKKIYCECHLSNISGPPAKRPSMGVIRQQASLAMRPQIVSFIIFYLENHNGYMHLSFKPLIC